MEKVGLKYTAVKWEVQGTFQVPCTVTAVDTLKTGGFRSAGSPRVSGDYRPLPLPDGAWLG